MSVTNAQLMSALWLSGTSSYQQRISSPNVASVSQQVAELWEPGNQNFRNEFISGLLNRVGLSYVRQHSWANPLAVFKKRKLPYGSSVLEAQAKLMMGRTYDDSRETLLKVHRPEIAQAVHKIDYFMQYPFTINLMELRRAAEGETGLNEFVASLFDAVMASAAWDEYKSMLQLLSWYDEHLGMYRTSLALPTDEATSKAFLQKVRELAGLLQFPSGKYLAQSQDIQEAGLTVWAAPQDLVLMTTPAVKAAIDVQALSAAFQLPYSEIEQRIVLVDEMPMADVYAVLTTADFFQVYDEHDENGSFYNPETLNEHNFYTKTAIHSVSPFVPLIAFTTGAGTVDDTITQTVTTNRLLNVGLVGRNLDGNLEAIDTTQVALTKAMVDRGVYVVGELDGSLSLGDVTGATEIDGVTVRPDAVVVTGIELSGTGAPVKNSRTYVDINSRLHFQAGAYKTADPITVTLTYRPAYVNPSGETPAPQTGTFSFEVGGQNFNPGPEPQGPNLSDFLQSATLANQNGAIATLSGTQLDGQSPSFGEIQTLPNRMTIERLSDAVTGIDIEIQGTSGEGPWVIARQSMELSGDTFSSAFGFLQMSVGSTAYINLTVTTTSGVIESTMTVVRIAL